MIYQIGLRRAGASRQLYLAPGVVLSIFDPAGATGRCRLRRALRPRVHGPDVEDGPLEALVEWLDDAGRRTGRLAYLPLRSLFPDVGARVCRLR